MATTDLGPEALAEFRSLEEANRRIGRSFPGESAARQPVHTFYGGAHLYRAEISRQLGEDALCAMAAHARDAADFARGVGLSSDRFSAGEWLETAVYERVMRKLQGEAVEDLRIDFEDGFGARSDADEDATAIACAHELARGLKHDLLPPFVGIRIKSLGEDWKRRALRTLELFVDALLARSGGELPEHFVVTLPKVTLPEQPRLLVRVFEALERRHRLVSGALRLELMVETTQALIGPDGRLALPELLRACEGRCLGAHLGTYDFTAACNVTAAHQSMLHPLCDLARGLMTLALAGTGVFLSDGSTNLLPVGLHREPLTPEEAEQNRAAVHAAWRLSYRSIRHSLESGFYQGWDLHPAQLPVRYAACYAFFLEGLPTAARRLRSFLEQASAAAPAGDVLEDAATGQALLNYFLRALNSGAIGPEELTATGLTLEEIALRSFPKILAARRGSPTPG